MYYTKNYTQNEKIIYNKDMSKILQDGFNRKIDYLRISITDRCNLRCVYCMPETGINLIEKNEILSYEEILLFAKAALRRTPGSKRCG